MTTTYKPDNGPVATQTYGNGDRVTYEYDKYERVTGIYKKTGTNSEIRAVTNRYNKNGELTDQQDHENNILTKYSYDLTGRLTEKRQSDLNSGSTSGHLSQSLIYDDKNRVSDHIQTLTGGASVKSSYHYGSPGNGEEPGLIYGMSVDGTKRQSLVYDEMGRLVKKTIGPESGNPWTTEYTYVKGSSQEPGSTTLLIGSVKDRDKTLYYEYDQMGNIVKVEEQQGTGARTVKAIYAYDILGQLIREDNGWTNETVQYAYDKGGNMLTKKVYDHTTGEITSAMSPKDTAGYSYEKPNAAVI